MHVAPAVALLLAMAAPAWAAGRAVSLTASDGTTLAGTLYEPAVRPAPAVVLVHMLGRTKEDWESLANQLEAAGAVILAIDLRGHGRSSGSAATLPPLVDDVRAALAWVAARPGVRPNALAVVGASLGANLALLASADNAAVRAIALLSPAGDYRGVRLDAGAVKKVADRPMWLAASLHDPYALRTVRELAQGAGVREQRLSDATAHGTNLLLADHDLARGLVDWLRRALIF